jgi:hypothetical protein
MDGRKKKNVGNVANFSGAGGKGCSARERTNVVVQLEILQMRRARKSFEKQHKCRNKSSKMIQKAEIQKKDSNQI